MKKPVESIKTTTHKISRSTVLLLVGVLVLGVVFGVLGTKLYQDNNSRNTAKKQAAASTAKREELVTQLVDKSYSRAKTQIAAAKKSGQLADEQASKVQKKVDEAYAYRKDHVKNTKGSFSELSKKRHEWREWAKANNIPYRYFVGL